MMIASRLLAARRYNMESSSPSKSGPLVLYRYLDRDVFGAMLLFLAFLSSSSTKPSNGTFIKIWKLSFELSYRGCWPIFRIVLSDGVRILFIPFSILPFQLFRTTGNFDSMALKSMAPKPVSSLVGRLS